MVALRAHELPAAPDGMASALPRISGHPTIKGLIYETLRERIVFGELRPGDRLIEAELATRFGVSKTPVREALLTLQAEGLVTLRPHRGAEVTRLSPEEYRDLQLVRDALEFGAMPEIIGTISEAHIVEAEVHLADMEAAYAADDYKRYRRAQRRLHGVLLGAPGSPTLAELATNLNDRLDRYGRLLVGGRRDRWADDLELNRRRLDLIRRRDAEGVVRLIKARHAEAAHELKDLIAGAIERLAAATESPVTAGRDGRG